MKREEVVNLLSRFCDYLMDENNGVIHKERIDMFLDSEEPNVGSKEYNINKIKEVIAEWGSTTACELELDASPCIASIGNGATNTSQLVEGFFADSVEVSTYIGGSHIDTEIISYEDLSDDIISEIKDIMDDYDADQYKTAKRIAD
jgi:hypothetical protein